MVKIVNLPGKFTVKQGLLTAVEKENEVRNLQFGEAIPS